MKIRAKVYSVDVQQVIKQAAAVIDDLNATRDEKMAAIDHMLKIMKRNEDKNQTEPGLSSQDADGESSPSSTGELI